MSTNPTEPPVIKYNDPDSVADAIAFYTWKAADLQKTANAIAKRPDNERLAILLHEKNCTAKLTGNEWYCRFNLSTPENWETKEFLNKADEALQVASLDVVSKLVKILR